MNDCSQRKRKGTPKKKRPEITIELPEDFGELSLSPKKRRGTPSNKAQAPPHMLELPQGPRKRN